MPRTNITFVSQSQEASRTPVPADGPPKEGTPVDSIPGRGSPVTDSPDLPSVPDRGETSPDPEREVVQRVETGTYSVVVGEGKSPERCRYCRGGRFSRRNVCTGGTEWTLMGSGKETRRNLKLS